MPLSWKESFSRTLRPLSRAERPGRVAVLGIGQTLRGDDAAGVAVARRLQQCHGGLPGLSWLVLEAGPAPENLTGSLRRFRPDLVLFVDAAEMGEPPGTVRWLAPEETIGLGGNTHTLPPYVLARFLTAELGCQVAVLGIQPADTTLGAVLSGPVQAAVEEVAALLSAQATMDDTPAHPTV